MVARKIQIQTEVTRTENTLFLSTPVAEGEDNEGHTFEILQGMEGGIIVEIKKAGDKGNWTHYVLNPKDLVAVCLEDFKRRDQQ